jgi:hypothetical protein
MPTTEEPQASAESETPETTKTSQSTDRHAIAVAAALLVACGGLVTYGILDSGEEPAARQAAPTAEVTYEVLGKGTADISYLGAGGSERADVVKNARLPWKKTVSVPLGKAPIVNVALGEKGGEASCTLAIRGKHIQRATASGAFGRTTCSNELPDPKSPAAPEAQ